MRLRAIATRSTGIPEKPGKPPIIDELFGSGEQGCFYDPSDMSTLFQDSLGTIPVTSVDQPVGLILDKSGNGNHASQTAATCRPVLKQDANGCYYLGFDGVDDFLSAQPINFNASDKAMLSAGLRKLSDTVTGVVAELSVNSGMNSHTFALFAPVDAADRKYQWRSMGTLDGQAFTGGYPAPITNVVTGLGDISGRSAILRVNGAQAVASTVNQGIGTYGNYPLYIGRRGGASMPFNGHLYLLIIRGALTSDAQIQSAEKYINTKTMAF